MCRLHERGSADPQADGVALVQTFFKHDMPSRVEAKREAEREHAANVRKWDAEVDRRDGRRCRCCGRRSDPEATGLLEKGHRHHIVYRSAQGSDEPFNKITLCAFCHDDEHHDRLRFSADGLGAFDANGPMEFWRKDDDGTWFLGRREIAIHRAERD